MDIDFRSQVYSEQMIKAAAQKKEKQWIAKIIYPCLTWLNQNFNPPKSGSSDSISGFAGL